jgi:hypothetical protein
MTWLPLLTTAFLAAASLVFPEAPIQHRLLLADEGNGNLLFDDGAGGSGWTVPIPGNGRDIQLIGGGRAMVNSLAGGYCEFDLADGSLKKQVKGFGAVQSARRLPNGHTILAGTDLDGSLGTVALELDAQDRKTVKAVFPGLVTLRMMRLTAEGHLLVGSGTKVVEGDLAGKIVWQAEVPGATIYKALRLAGGNTWVSTGYTATLVLLSPDGRILKTVGGTSLPAAVNAHFFADFQLLPDGHLIVANWQNHGPGHGSEGVQLLEFDSSGALVWQYHQDPARISSLHGVLVLDGLDPRQAYDEREGFMVPWVPAALRIGSAPRSAFPRIRSPWIFGFRDRLRDPAGRALPSPNPIFRSR